MPSPQIRSSRVGKLGWLIVPVIIFGGIWVIWRHEPPKKAAPPKVVATKPQPKPFVLSRQAPTDFPRPVRDVFEAQVAMVRCGISPGPLDAAVGSQTRMALSAFQQSRHLPVTGKLDDATRAQLMLAAPVVAMYTVTTQDLARLQPLGKTWIDKSQQTALDYETELEMIAEKSHSHQAMIRLLNPNVTWTNIAAGTALKVPDADYPDPTDKAAFVVIHLSSKCLEAFDVQSNLLVHFPCSIAAKVEKRPVGELHVIAVAPDPNYTFDPELFPEAPESKTLDHRLIIPPGPNNPVGVAWIGLDRTGYGIHGTPIPEQVGRTESHGCFRLANWDAEYLTRLVSMGLPVYVLE